MQNLCFGDEILMNKELDLIDRNELYNQIRLYLNRQSLGETTAQTTLTIGEIASIITDMPSVDAESIVRCKGCEYNKYHICTRNQCPVCGHPLYVKDVDFCSYGKPKE